MQKLDARLQKGDSTPPGGQFQVPTYGTLDPQVQADDQAAMGEARPSSVPGTQVDTEPPGLVGRVIGRLFGTDVDDPLPWTRVGTTIAGSIAGGVYGSRIPGPPAVKAIGALAGGVAGTVAGAAAPEATIEGLEAIGVLEPGTREKTGLSNENLMTVLEGEALLDVATMGGVSLIRGAGRGMTSLLTGANRGTRAMAEDATRQGIAMLPVQVGERQFARGFVSVMGHFPYIASGLKDKAERAMGQISNAFENLPARFGPLATYDEASANILRDARGFLDNLNTQYTTRYTELLRQADFRGITVSPVNTRAVTERILKQIQKETPRALDGTTATVTKDMADLRGFINKTTKLMYDTGGNLAPQAMRQMDTLLQTVDEKLVKVAKGGNVQAVQRLEQIRQGVQLDMVNNAISGAGKNATALERQQAAEATRALTGEFRALDTELTTTVNDLMNSATSGKLGWQRSPTLRGIRMTDQAGRTDNLAKVIMQGDSPDAVNQLARITSPETMRSVASSVMREALDKSMTEAGSNGRLFDVDQFSKTLGLSDRSSLKYQQTQALLGHAGGLTMPEVERLTEIARRASEAEIPDTSTFIARRAALAGIHGLVKTIIPFAAVGGTAYGGGAVAAIMTVGGARMFSNMIANPASARALRSVIDEESRTVVRRTATMRAMEIAGTELVQTGEMAASEARDKMLQMRDFFNELDKGIANTKK